VNLPYEKFGRDVISLPNRAIMYYTVGRGLVSRVLLFLQLVYHDVLFVILVDDFKAKISIHSHSIVFFLAR